MEEKKGVLTEIVFYNEENGYTIAEMETDDELLTVVGNLSHAAKGTCYELRGTFKIHPKYGEQFAFTEAMEVMPSSRVGIEGFLASGVIKGVGPKTASAIVSVFGEDTLRIMDEEPGRLCQISGVGKKKAADIARSFAEHKEFADVSLFFQGFGVSAASALRLYKVYGRDSVQLIKENPYRLVEEVNGIGFRKADEIAEKMGIESNSPFRIKSGIRYYLWFFIGDGNTYMPQEELCEKVAELLDLTREQISDNLIEMAFTGDVQVDNLNGKNVVYLYAYYAAEQKVCSNVTEIARSSLKSLCADIDKTIAMTEKSTGIELSEQQKSAVKKSLTSGVSVITGGPGTGKTTIINTIINIFEESDFKVAIAAPTGRAAKRITETSGHYASTIHRLLEYYYSESDDDMQFGKNAEDQLEYDAVIVDEASMIDLMLMQGLTEAIKAGTRLIMVGDSDQLPSVGAGNVLLDIVESGFVQTSKLTEIFRQAEESMIVVNAHKINHGEYPSINGRNTDFFFMERNNENDILDLIIQLATHRLPDYYADIDGLSDIQILTPTRKGTIGTASLNDALQMAFNPPAEGVSEKKYRDHIFRTGDKVMQIRNNYQMNWKIPGEMNSGQGVFNGDVGFIKAVDNEYGKITVIYDDEKYAEYDFSQLDELELAYAVTVHKSQGSEFPIVIMPISWFPPMLATRNLLYTAVTRGKQAVVLVGMENRMRAMIDNDRIKMRYSGLKERLIRVMAAIE